MDSDKDKRQQELAHLMLHKARQDFDAAQNLGNSRAIADEIIGFHAQQAIEKALKAVLTRAGAEYEFTHDLVTLFEEIAKAGFVPPAAVDEVEELTPFAVQFRYAIFSDAEPLDRQSAIQLAAKFIQWAHGVIEK